MKHNLLFFKILKSKKQKGQSLIEFVLLFVIIVFWGLILTQEANGFIATYWESIIKIIVNDTSQNIQLN